MYWMVEKEFTRAVAACQVLGVGLIYFSEVGTSGLAASIGIIT